MTALGYLGIALVIAVVGGVIVAVALREPSSKRGDGVDQFRRRMNALAPDDDSVVIADRTRAQRRDPDGPPPPPPAMPDPPVKPIPRSAVRDPGSRRAAKEAPDTGETTATPAPRDADADERGAQENP